VGKEVEGVVKNITEFGLFIGLPEDIDGMAHLSDLSWNKPGEEALAEYKKGQTVQAKVLEVDIEKERISLGIKQLTTDPFKASGDLLKKGKVVTCTVTKVGDKGIDVEVGEGVSGFIRRGELSRDRSEQRPDRFAPGEKIDAKITNIDRSSGRVTLSIKAREVAEEKMAVANYGSTDSGASLGDILGAAIEEKKAAGEKSEKPVKKAAPKKAEDGKKADAEDAEKAEKPAKKAAKKKAEAKPKAETKAKAKPKPKAKD
jgi:small subunit ribosomal protein S1